MRALLVILFALLACDSPKQEAPKPSAPAATKPAQPAPPAAQPKAKPDPWQVAPGAADPDAPPSLVERHKLADAACPTVTGPYFYRIEKAGKVSHILGTRHVGVPLAKFPPIVKTTIESAKLAIFEVGPTDHGGVPHAERSLPNALGPELWQRYSALVGEDTAKMVERATPSTAMIAMIAMYEDIGSMLDMEIEHEVVAAHIPARGLERGVFQDKLLDKLLDLRMLRAAIQHTKDRAELAKDSRKDLVEYCEGTDDEPGMDKDMRKDLLDAGYTSQELDKIDDELVYARNADWIPKLEKILATDHVFIAVGADHLSGPRGVVALLQKRGYTITRITK